ncbi:hypothetical protein CHS0354_007969 [Potamilus streckersoni]|uniref:Uncharacterized protein n=1 Tax=Potamilus streckersoni TaxID=2493646 RepID=A0AAE0SC64_9BIVA|nr:hypothetical protein CHS0354_007969 [Potamilus streckersoni]
MEDVSKIQKEKNIKNRTNCYQRWTMEYTRYLMSGAAGDEGATNYLCKDKNPKAVKRGSADDLDHSTCLVDVHCGSLPCPPNVEGRQLDCVVSSK